MKTPPTDTDKKVAALVAAAEAVEADFKDMVLTFNRRKKLNSLRVAAEMLKKEEGK